MAQATGKEMVCDGDVCRFYVTSYMEKAAFHLDKVLMQMVDKSELSAAATAGADEGKAAMRALLGDTLLAQNKEVSSDIVGGRGKYVGLYFSAHWCPPCRGFTPKLAKFYQQFKASHPQAANFDIVFVSSDKTKSEFASYYADMPWKALPYKDRATKQKLSAKFKVSGIPKFVIVDAETDKVVTGNGREAVESDPTGSKFPWMPPSLSSLLAGPLVNSTGETKQMSELTAGKVVAVYFSAHWCPPCRGFTPLLAEFYKKVQGTSKEFEVIFVSSDRDEGSFSGYLSEMPWWAVPYSESARRTTLSTHFAVESIPTLVVLSEGASKVFTTDGTSCLRSDPEGADFPWAPRPVEKLNAAAVPRLNDGETCFVLFTDDFTPAGVQRAEELLIDSALPEFVKDEPEEFFYVCDAADKLPARLREMLQLSGDTPHLVMMALPQYAVAPSAASAADVQAFVSACRSKSVKLESLQ